MAMSRSESKTMTEDKVFYRSSDILDFLESRNYTSLDPYSGLRSPISKLLPTRTLKRALIQTFKLAPNRLHKLVGVPQIQMSTTLGYALSGAANLGTSISLERREKLAKSLLRSQNPDGGWGYEFDVFLRWGKYLQGESNLVATSVCASALIEAGIEGKWRDGVINFLESTFRSGYFSYCYSGSPLIHNANLLAASVMSRLNGDKDKVTSAISSSMNCQQADGSWFYGEHENLKWIDNFHTVYVLEALMDMVATENELEQGIAKGFDFWLENMFVDNQPKYYLSDTNPTRDINTLASAISLLSHPYVASNLELKKSELIEALLHQLMDALNALDWKQAKFRWDLAPASLALSKWEN